MAQFLYIKNEEHDQVLLERIKSTQSNLCIATANIKDLKILGESLFDIFNELVSRGVKIRIICMKPTDKASEELRGLGNNKLFKCHVCPRNHMKLFIFDRKLAYIGSANLTNAAMGKRSDSHRNFEAGILTDERSIVKQAKDHFDEAWCQPICDSCSRKSCEYKQSI